ncbi:MAG: transporter substrate-binding domain-containing protein [Proteobacteria bacterium]|nr:transporter substrate-binding domain-containing protein [Pseudomonadota bacterium]
MLKKVFLLWVFFFFWVLAGFPVLGNDAYPNRSIRVSVFPLAPLNFVNESGQADGLYPDLIRQIAKENSLQLEFVAGTWAESMDRLLTGDIDLLTTVAHSPEREKLLTYSEEPVLDIWGQIFLRPGSDVNNILELEGKKIAVMEKDINGLNFIKTSRQFGVSCEIIKFPTHAAVFESVKKGEVVAGVAPQHYGLRHAGDFGLIGSSIQFAPFSIYFATRKGEHLDLLKQIDSQLARWKLEENSYYNRRITHWMGARNYEKSIVPLWLLWTLVAVVVVSLVLFFNNRILSVRFRQQTRELDLSERQYRSLVESANTVILRWDSTGMIVFLNRFGLELFGYTPEEIIGRHVMDTIVPETEGSGRDLSFMINDILEHPENYELNENENMCRDGRRVYIQWSNRAITDGSGRFKEMLSVGTDITQRRELERELFQAQKMEAIGTLAGGIAHDFNNILSVIIGNIELALLQKKSPEKFQSFLETAKKASQRASDLVNQILTFSRRPDVPKQPLHVSSIVKEALKMLRSTLPTTISIEQNIQTEGMVFSNPTQIHQVVMNLCTNAYHAMGEMGGKLTVNLSELCVTANTFVGLELEQGEYILLEVRDTGLGIDSECIKKIFEPYFTTKEKGKGTGLGLAVVHGIVKELKGDVRVSCEAGQGAVFQVYLPKCREDIPFSVPELLEKDVSLCGTETIMVVDDERDVRHYLEEVLRMHGYTVSCFANGRSAQEAFDRNPDLYQALVTDMTMPGITGEELSKNILRNHPGFPIILCTGYSQAMNREKADEIGVAAFLQKPVILKDLLKKVRQLLD